MSAPRRLFHGGIAGLSRGDKLVPSPPHEHDGCPVCVARSEGRTLTAGEYLKWARLQGPAGQPVVDALEGVHPMEPIDPPSGQDAVYLTSHELYATWYAARSGNGDLYEVAPLGTVTVSTEDNFPTWIAPAAIVTNVLRRRVRLTRKERRQLDREWAKADKRSDRIGV